MPYHSDVPFETQVSPSSAASRSSPRLKSVRSQPPINKVPFPSFRRLLIEACEVSPSPTGCHIDPSQRATFLVISRPAVEKKPATIKSPASSITMSITLLLGPPTVKRSSHNSSSECGMNTGDARSNLACVVTDWAGAFMCTARTIRHNSTRCFFAIGNSLTA